MALVTVALCLMVARNSGVAPWRLVLAGLFFYVADLPILDIRFRHDNESYTCAEVSVVLGLFLLPLPFAVLVAAVCVGAQHVLRGLSVRKVAFNTSGFTVGLALAGVVVATTSQGPSLTWSRAFSLVLAAMLFSLWNMLSVDCAVSLAAAVPFRLVLLKGLRLRVMVCTGNVGVAVAVLAMVTASPLTVLAIPPTLVLLYLSYRGYLQTMQERDLWQQLESAARELNALDERHVVSAAITRVAQMLKADVVELVVGGGDDATHYRGDARGLLEVGHALASPAYASVMNYSEWLLGPQGPIGVLRVGFTGPVELTRRERQVLTTFGHSVSSSLQNSRMYVEMRAHAEEKAHEAAHDALTGLGNRTLLHARAAEYLAVADAGGSSAALLIVDLDHFKEVNDTLGHASGDQFLQLVAGAISRAVPQHAVVCRLGGDEFAVLLGVSGTSDADAAAGRLLQVLAEPVTFDGLRLSIEGSVGVACYPQDAGTFEELLRRADVALYHAKASRGAFAHYDQERDDSSVQRLALAAELRTALVEDQLEIHLQPQYDLRTGAVVAAEALVRWRHPRRGMLPPGAFVSVVEHSGLVHDFTLTVLRKAVAECAGWRAQGFPVPVAVNLSARNLLDRDLPGDVRAVLARAGLPPELLVLEITETTMMSELDVVEDVLGQLRGLGVQLSVDDFGTGYSSLAFLQRVQVNEVKVDRSFVFGLGTSDSDRALVRAVVQLAHSLGARVVAEGVQDGAMLAQVRALGCDLAQGFDLGVPLPPEDFRRLLARPPLELPPVGVVAPMPRAPRHLEAVTPA